jgi:predicted MFS family arabinose efflux permease
MAETILAASQTPARRSRWLLLVAFALLTACSQVLWVSFAPITPQAHQALGVSEGAIGDLAVIGPLLSVVFGISTGRWLDRRFGLALTTGALLTAVGAVLRAVEPSSYAWVFAGQFVLSVGLPIVTNATTGVGARYFPPTERTAAISVGSAAQFVGILVGALTGEALFNAGGLRLMLVTHAAVTMVAAAALILTLRQPPAYASKTAAASSLTWLWRNRLMWRLAALLFIGFGVFNALATWLETILANLGHPGVGGTMIAVMTVAGVAGAVVLPGIAARRDRRRALLVVVAVVSVVAGLVLPLVPGVLLIGCVLAVAGFFELSALPLVLDWSELETGPARAGTATGFLMLVGNLGGVVFVLLVQPLIGSPYLALAAVSAMAAPGILLAWRLPATTRSHLDDRQPVSSGGDA